MAKKTKAAAPQAAPTEPAAPKHPTVIINDARLVSDNRRSVPLAVNGRLRHVPVNQPFPATPAEIAALEASSIGFSKD